MNLKIGQIDTYLVKRKTDIAYALCKNIDDEEEIFLHSNEATKELVEGEKIQAFLYYDSKRRLCASMQTPIISTTNKAFVKVVSVVESLGCFVNIGISKDMLVSKDFLPNNPLGWPKVDEEIPCILKEKKDSLVARLLTREDLSNKELLHSVGEVLDATIVCFTPSGMLAISKEFEIIYIHSSLTRGKFHVGQNIFPKIININEKNEYNGSLIEQKELMMDKDKEMLLKFLNNFGGVLNLGNKSTAEEIKKLVGLSKSAFKRAVGGLYKERLITIEDYKIILVENK